MSTPVADQPFILFLTGASGAGKTTALRLMEQRFADRPWVFVHADGTAMLTPEEHATLAATPERWQELFTHRWVEIISRDHAGAEVVVLDMQADFRFIRDACRRCALTRYAIVLVDCDWPTMRGRLIDGRRQPELANADMENWARHLRQQAALEGVLIVDTSRRTPQEAADAIAADTLAPLQSERPRGA